MNKINEIIENQPITSMGMLGSVSDGKYLLFIN